MEASVFELFRTLRRPIFYAGTKFSEGIFINGGDMPQKGIRKTLLGSGILAFIRSVIVQNFS